MKSLRNGLKRNVVKLAMLAGGMVFSTSTSFFVVNAEDFFEKFDEDDGRVKSGKCLAAIG